MADVLITGIDGFTGRYLRKELHSHGYSVVGLGHEPTNGVFCCDLLDRAGLADVFTRIHPAFVVHLAGIAFVGDSDADRVYRTNVVGTRNLLEVLSSSHCTPKSIILASSANVYGNTSVVPTTENTSVAPINDYAVSKVAMELMARLWFDKLPITLVRPFNYTGVGQSIDFLLPKIVDHFRRRASVLELGNLDVVREFSDVRSVVKTYHLLLEAARGGEVFNICSGRGYSLLEVLSYMRELTDYYPEIRINPAFVRSNEVRRLVGSRAKLDSAIGFVADIPLKETLKWMLESSP